MFNHESPLRDEQFVSRKIVSAVVRIANGSGERLALGRLDIERDWGWAPDYVRAMWMMLQADEATDYVIATGVCSRLEDFVAEAFACVGLNWRDHVDFDPTLVRPYDIVSNCGDSTLARRELGWEPTVTMPELVGRLIEAERSGSSPGSLENRGAGLRQHQKAS